MMSVLANPDPDNVNVRVLTEWSASCCVYASTMFEVQGLPSLKQHASDGS